MSAPNWPSPTLAIGTPSPTCVAFINRYVLCVLRYGDEWGIIQSAVQECPKCPIALLLQADLCMAAEDVPAAVESVNAAAALLPAASPSPALDQLSLYHDAWKQWTEGNLLESARSFEGVLAACPTDSFALKRAQLLYFLGGSPADMARVAQLPAVVDALSGTPFYHGMLAFALEQCGDSGGAEREGRRGTEVAPDDAWSHHAVAHALYNQARLAEGLLWLQGKAHLWTHLCSFMVTHNNFHIALNHIDMCDTTATLSSFDGPVWGVDKGCMQDQMGALGLLLKMHVRAVTQGLAETLLPDVASAAAQGGAPPAVMERLRDVTSYCLKKLEYHGDPFFDGLIAYALSVCGFPSELEAFHASAAAAVDKLHPARASQVATAWLECMRALAQFGAGKYGEACTHFAKFAFPGGPGAAVLDSAALGNSAEQRDVLDETYILCLLLSGNAAEALRLSWHRSKARPSIPADTFTQAVGKQFVGAPAEEVASLVSTAASQIRLHSLLSALGRSV